MRIGHTSLTFIVAFIAATTSLSVAHAEVLSEIKISSLSGLPSQILDPGDRFGTSVASIGDLDGDGIGDVAVGAPRDDDGGADRGAVWILFLEADGSVKSHQKISSTYGDFTGTLTDYEYFGQGLCNLGDLDGDTVTDIAVGAPNDEGTGQDQGAVWVLFLHDDGTVKSHYKITTTDVGGGFGDFDRAGQSVAAMSGNRIVVGQPEDDDGGANRGAVWVLTLMATGAPSAFNKISQSDLTGTIPNGARFGWSCAAIGDLDGDTFEDIAVGAPNDFEGHLWILRLDGAANVIGEQLIDSSNGGFLTALPSSGFFGGAVCSTGDLDGDGRGDIAVSAYGAGTGGRAWTLYLNADGTVKATQPELSAGSNGFTGTIAAGDQFGRSLSFLGDHDSDGLDDIAIGINLNNGGGANLSGGVWNIALNADESVAANLRISNDGNLAAPELAAGDFFGSAVVSFPDQNNDGVDELLVGAPSDDDGGSGRGAIYVCFMNSDGTVQSYQKISDTAGNFTAVLDNGDNFGNTIAVVGDLDNNGIPEVVVGATGDDDAGSQAGAGYLLFLNSNGTVSSFQKYGAGLTGLSGGAELGWSSAGPGDVDGNGVPDVALGGPVNNTGYVWILFLNADGTMSGSNRIDNGDPGLSGLQSGDLFGSGLDAIGDLDGNNVCDIAAGAGFAGNVGQVHVLFLDSAGDVIASTLITSNTGGFATTLGANDEFGRSVANIGDLDGNGVDDIAVGANFDDDGGGNRGAVYVLLLDGAGQVIAEEKISETTGGFGGTLDDNDRFGTEVAGIGDFDNDGMIDIAVGVPRDDDGGADAGAVWLLMYDCPLPDVTPPLPSPAIARFATTSQDRPESHLPDYAPPRTPGTNTIYTLHDEDFEGAHGWSPDNRSGHPDFTAQLHAGATVVQETTSPNLSQIWGFFDIAVADYACGGFPAQGAIPFIDGFNRTIEGMTVSPMIDWNTDISSTAVPASATEAYLEFDVYTDLPLDNLVFYYWQVRFFDASMDTIIVTGSNDGWLNNNFVYYGDDKEWHHRKFAFGTLVPTTPPVAYVEVGVGVWDFANTAWNGTLGTGTCHSHAPLIDNVTVTRVDPPTLWAVNPAHLFQDNFAGDGTLTGTVRMDMAFDTNPGATLTPGDSAVVTVTEPVNGLGIDPGNGGAAVYIHVKDLPGGKSGAAISGGPRWPLVAQAGGWTTLRLDSVYVGCEAVPDRYCVDLADDLYVPGDTIWYYFSANDAFDQPSYWTEFLEVSTTAAAEAEHLAMEMTCLPANGLGEGDILYVDAVDGGGVEPFHEWSFYVLNFGHMVDRYDMRAPSQLVNNALSSRVTNQSTQINEVYRKIIWDSGDLPESPIPDGTGLHEFDDYALLYGFLENLDNLGGIMLAGDDLPTAWTNSTSPNAASLSGYLSYSLASSDHHALGETNRPYVVGQPGGCFFNVFADSFIAYGAGTWINEFDVMTATGSATVDMAYSNNPAHAAIVTQESVNPQLATVRAMVAGFSTRFVREDRPVGWLDRSFYLLNILECLWNVPPFPVSADPPRLRPSLAQNVPNPFNPRTDIGFTVARTEAVELSVYDVGGALVRTLVRGTLAPDTYRIPWDGTDDHGTRVASGVYFYRLATPSFRGTRKMVLLK